MKLRTVFLAGLLLLGAFAPVAAGQTGGANAPTERSECYERLDQLTVIEDCSFADGILRIHLNSTAPNVLSVTETSSEDGASRVRVTQETVPAGEFVLRIDVFASEDPTVLITSRRSINNETGVKVSIETSDPLVGGPWGARDAQVAGLSGGVAVAGSVLVVALRKKLGASDGGERVA